MVLRTTVLPQLLFLTKKRKKKTDHIAINCLRRATKQANKKQKIEQDKKEEVEE